MPIRIKMNRYQLSQKWSSFRSVASAKQTGQALPLGLAFIMVGMLGAFVLFNTGQVAVDKQRLANASDSAAYSGMVWQARALNFQAYSNRAMVANQVAMGQAVSLYSWAAYADQTALHAELTLGNVPYIGPFVRTMTQIIQNVATNMVQPVAEAMLNVIDPINKAVKISQDVMYASSFAATPDIVRDVAKASDDRFTADTAYSALGFANNLVGVNGEPSWKDFTQSYGDADMASMQERTDLVNDSRDEFTQERYWDFFDDFWVYSTPITKHKVIREGETRLVMIDNNGTPEWEWVAKDSLAFETKIWRGWRGTKSIEAPMGWGAAYANSKNSREKVITGCRNRTLSRDDCKFYDRNNNTTKLADREINQLNGYTGINAFRSISEKIKNLDDGEAVLQLKIEVSMDIEDVVSSNKTISNDDTFSTPMVSPANTMSSISVAEVYYRRPEAYKTSSSRDISLEAANGYNPYWDVRLAAVSKVDRLAVGIFGSPTGSTLPGGRNAEALADYNVSNPDDETDSGENDTDSGIATDQSAQEDYLASYADTSIASSLGIAEGATSNLLASLAAGPEEFAAAAIEGFIPIDDMTAQLQKELTEQVQEVAKNFVEGALTSAIDNVAPGFRQTVDNAETVVQPIIDEAKQLSEAYETMRENVQQEFQAELESRVAQYDHELGEVSQFLTDAQILRDDLKVQVENYGVNSEDILNAPTLIQDALADAELAVAEHSARVDELKDELKDGLTDYLVERENYSVMSSQYK